MNTIETERLWMENQFPSSEPQAWYDSLPDPVCWDQIVPLLKDKVVLDFGCGSGWLGMKAKAAGAKSVIGTDIFSTYCHPDLKFLKCNHQLWFQRDRFDVIITANTLHHLADLSCGVREIEAVLKSGGHFVSFQEPCIPNDEDEQDYLALHCNREIANGICERRPNLKKYREAFKTWEHVDIFESSDPIWSIKPKSTRWLNDKVSIHCGIGIHAIK